MVMNFQPILSIKRVCSLTGISWESRALPPYHCPPPACELKMPLCGHPAFHRSSIKWKLWHCQQQEVEYYQPVDHSKVRILCIHSHVPVKTV